MACCWKFLNGIFQTAWKSGMGWAQLGGEVLGNHASDRHVFRISMNFPSLASWSNSAKRKLQQTIPWCLLSLTCDRAARPANRSNNRACLRIAEQSRSPATKQRENIKTTQINILFFFFGFNRVPLSTPQSSSLVFPMLSLRKRLMSEWCSPFSTFDRLCFKLCRKIIGDPPILINTGFLGPER